ncbi:predicted protein [Plenodomus lingam JN3]|uniref:Predicted protein n=1 Tax=Leptosphaeria maculans (strain JN3 / isolate v23.1.3 / race Av1-4-5-6-7-8) TaxID=985895 RepID=E4ZYE2_LEPMJ|nr:predicted protein [Plenodomus lingam JN3]CBX96387.1 predicted protein [Plenodomus lingam JN3]
MPPGVWGIGKRLSGLGFSMRLALDHQGGDGTSDEANNMRAQDSNQLVVAYCCKSAFTSKHSVTASAGLFIASVASLSHRTTIRSNRLSSPRTTRNFINMAKFFTIVAALAFALTALASPNPNPQSCGGTAIPGSDCSFHDQCRSCNCRNGICA